ncbi:hypothetical protein [Paenibacillus aestuarii]|uniref:Uncharacterized protein n=1 Tax=Paenibacillus aestuarii TaxID=516965 RepID=A0ABW0K3Y7_9BACL|nr:hypothetical protein [Paenibacillus aestuarii]
MTERKAVDRILAQLSPDLLDQLERKLSASDLNTLLLELFRNKTQAMTSGELLNSYACNRFVKPAAIHPIALKQLEIEMLQLAEASSYQAVQLAPVAPLGSCSVVGTVDQNKVLSALRGTEVVADATNALALHACDLIKCGQRPHREDSIRLCTTHRHLRAQQFSGPGMLPHFSLFCMITSGRDTGSYGFEKRTLVEHVRVYQAIFQALFQARMTVKFIRHGGYTDSEGLVQRLREHLQESLPNVGLTEQIEAGAHNDYYKGLQFHLIVELPSGRLTIGDGGFVDWSQQLLGNQKERMMISAIGIDRLMSETAR